MDDKLYYVESPDGQILGPMNMMHILEGIAAGVILETARICEVGAQEWVLLSDVAETREEEVGKPVAAAARHREEPATEPGDSGDVESVTSGYDAMESGSETVPEDDESKEEESMPLADLVQTDPNEFVPAAVEEEEETVAVEYDATQETSEALDDGDFTIEPDEPHEEEVPLATASSPAGSGEELAGEDASDFALPDEFEAGGAELEEAELAYAERGSGGRPKWLIPAAVALLIPIAVGVFLLSGREGPQQAAAPQSTQAVGPATPLQEARDLLVSGQAGEAMLRYERILENEPNDATALHGAGLAALEVGDPDTAIRDLERAVELRKDKPLWVAHLAEALHGADRLDSAVRKLDTYLKTNPEDRDWQTTRLDWMLQAGENEAAAKTYSALAEENPVSAFHQYLAGLARGEEPAAETYLRRSIELDPSNGDAHAALARVLAVAGKPEAAAESLERAFEQRPATTEERAFLASLNKAAHPKPDAPASKAAEVLAVVEKPVPKPAAVERTVAAAEPQPERPKPAPAPKPAVTTLATRADQVRDALHSERYDRAREILATARRELGGGKEVTRNVALWDAIIAFEEGSFDDALLKFQALNPEASYRASGWGAGAVSNWMARVHFAKGDVRKAVAALDGVGPSDPNEYALARLWEGLALATLGMDDLASRTWERIPADVGARVGEPGTVAVKSAELLTGSISEKDYRTAVAPLEDFENDMHFFLAYAAQRHQDTEGAKAHFAKAVEMSKGKEFPYYLARAEVSGNGILSK